MEKRVIDFMKDVSSKNLGETEFLQAVEEVEAVIPFIEENPRYKNKICLNE